ncbi:MAG: CinA family protein [Thalassobaculum sp.]|uniref:CinA family protein n=1 Tax=Thalassobaculum sp. TaxID=2022740 RepID=UPI0032EBAEC1
MLPETLIDAATALLYACREAGMTIATAESCTGGLVASCLTEVPGSSDVFERGFVTYSNDAKAELLGVPMQMITRHGAVSEEVAKAMAIGALARSRALMTISITGVAGPGGGTAAKPVGLVHFASAMTGGNTVHERHEFEGNRTDIRREAVRTALRILADRIPRQAYGAGG